MNKMFAKGFTITIKNLVRAKTFWLCIVLFLILVSWQISKAHFGYVDMEIYEQIMDIDPRFVLPTHTYYKLIGNVPDLLIKYLHPLVMIFLTVIILNRDYGDRFFEIEKAGGLRPSVYLLSRICALMLAGIGCIISYLRVRKRNI